MIPFRSIPMWKDILHATLVVGHQVFYGSRTRLSVSPSADPETLDWYKQAQENAGGPVYVGPHLDPFLQNEDTVVVSVVNVIRSLKDPQAVLAFVKVNADFSAIERICRQIDLGEGGGLLLLDDAGREVFRSVGQIQAEKLHTLGENGMLYADGVRYLVYQMPVEKPGWRLYGFVSQKTLQSDALETSRLSLMLGAACAALTVALLSSPLRRTCGVLPPGGTGWPWQARRRALCVSGRSGLSGPNSRPEKTEPDSARYSF